MKVSDVKLALSALDAGDYAKVRAILTAGPAPKLGKRYKARQIMAMNHAQKIAAGLGKHCYCRDCCADRGFVPFEDLAGCTGWPGTNGFADAVNTESRDTARLDRERELDVCACGHPSFAHRKDELENLLECKVTSGCDCTHFHYEVEAAA